MPPTEVQRTLVKSPPELWAELSDPDCLAKHLGAFGEIRITRVEHESSVAWEGERASGTVELAPSGWGTKVTLTVEEPQAAAPPPPPPPEPEPELVAEPEPLAEPEPEPEPPAVEPVVAERRRFWDRFRRRRAIAAPEPEPVAAEVPAPPAPDPAPEPTDPDPVPDPVPPEPDPAPPAAEAAVDVDTVLNGVLDDLGSAHHRPFSRG